MPQVTVGNPAHIFLKPPTSTQAFGIGNQDPKNLYKLNSNQESISCCLPFLREVFSTRCHPSDSSDAGSWASRPPDPWAPGPPGPRSALPWCAASAATAAGAASGAASRRSEGRRAPRSEASAAARPRPRPRLSRERCVCRRRWLRMNSGK